METGLVKSKDIFGKPKAVKLGSQFGGNWGISDLIEKEEETTKGIKTSAELFDTPTETKEKVESFSTPKESETIPDSEIALEIPSLDKINQKQDTLNSLGKDFEDVTSTIEENRPLYEDSSKRLDELEEKMQTAGDDLLFSYQLDYEKVRKEHNALVETLQTDTKKQKEIFGKIEELEPILNNDIDNYNKWIDTQNKKPKEAEAKELKAMNIEEFYTPEEMANRLKGKTYRTGEKENPTWGEQLKNWSIAGLNYTQGGFYKAAAMIDEGFALADEAIGEIRLVSPKKVEEFEKKYGFDPYTVAPLTEKFKEIAEDSYQRADKAMEKTETRDKLQKFMGMAIVPAFPVLTTWALTGGVAPVMTGMNTIYALPWVETLAQLGKMSPFMVMAFGGYANDIEEKAEALGEELPYWKHLTASAVLGFAEGASELEFFLGMTALVKKPVQKAVERGAKTLWQIYGPKAGELVKTMFSEFRQEATMPWIQTPAEKLLGFPVDMSPKALAKESLTQGLEVLPMIGLLAGLGGGFNASVTISSRVKRILGNVMEGKQSAKDGAKQTFEALDIMEEEPEVKTTPEVKVVLPKTLYRADVEGKIRISSVEEPFLYLSEDKKTADRFAHGGDQGRPGAKTRAYDVNLNIYNNEENNLLSEKGKITFEQLRDNKDDIVDKLKEADYDAIYVYELNGDRTIAVLDTGLDKVSVVEETVKTTPEVKTETKEPTPISSGKDVANEVVEDGYLDKDDDSFVIGKIKKQNYTREDIKISELLKNDQDLKDFVEAGEMREFEGEPFGTPPIVLESGEVLDGYNRILQKVKDGEDVIEIYKGYELVEVKKGKETPKTETKEPWEMTKEEYLLKNNIKEVKYLTPEEKAIVAKNDNVEVSMLDKKWIGNYGVDLKTMKSIGDGYDDNYAEVKQALSEGKSVPAEVLADYPDLKAEVKEEPFVPDENDTDRPETRDLEILDRVNIHGKSSISALTIGEIKGLLSSFMKYNTFYKDRYEGGKADWVENSLNDALLDKHRETPEVIPEETAPKRVLPPKTATSVEETVKALEAEAERLGKPSWEKMSRPEINRLLEKVKVFKDPGGKLLLKKVGVPNITAWKDEEFAKMGVLAGGKVHKVTDSHWMFIDDKVADAVIADQKKRMFEKQVKEYMSKFPDISKKVAEEYTINFFKEVTEGKDARVFPPWKPVLESAEKAKVKEKVYIQGHITASEKNNTTVLSNGLIQALVNSDYLNMMNKWLPDAEIRLGEKSTDMVSLVDKREKIQAVLMPIRFEEETAIPFDVWDIPGGVKPTAEEIARKEKDLAEEQRVKKEEEEGEYLKRPVVQETAKVLDIVGRIKKDSNYIGDARKLELIHLNEKEFEKAAKLLGYDNAYSLRSEIYPAEGHYKEPPTLEEFKKNKEINKKFVELHQDEVIGEINKIEDRNTRLLLRDSYKRVTEGKPIDTFMDHLLMNFSKDEMPLTVEDKKIVLHSAYDISELMRRKQDSYPEPKMDYGNALVLLDRATDTILQSEKLKGIEGIALEKYADIYIPGEKIAAPRMFVAEQQSLFEESEYQELSSRSWGQEMEKEAVTSKKINKTEIMTWAEKTFGFPIKGKATHKWKAAGVYYNKKQIVRMQKWGELAVAAHEISHGIDQRISKQIGGAKWKWGKIKGITGEFTKELADLDYDQSKRRTSEGFAEYMRYRLNQGLGEKKAPGFHKYLNEKILPQFPGLREKLDEFQSKLDIWNKQGSENRIIQHIDWKGEHSKRGIGDKLRKALDWVNVRFNDEFYFPQKITAEIEKVIGKELPPRKNPALLMEYSKSKSGAIARTFVMKAAVDEHGNVIGDSLEDILKPIPNKEMTQFISYAVSKRAIDLAGRKIESGFDIDDVNYMVNKYKDKGWDGTVKELTNWSNHALDWLVRAGGLDRDSTQLMRDLNPVYLPFKRAFIDEMNVVKGVGGYVDTGSGVKSIKGSGRPIINPLESMVTQMRELIAKSQKIRIAKAFIDLASEQGVGGFITRVPAPMKATTFKASQIKSYLDEIASGEEGMASSNEYNDFLTVFTQDFKYSGKENIVTIWKGGEQEFYEIHPDLYEAFKGVDPLKLGPITKVFAPFSRMLRLGATGLKLSFGLARNPFRDAGTYVVASKRMGATVFDPVKGYYKDITCKPGDITWRFKAMGGGLSGQIGLDRASVQNSYDEMLDDKLGKWGKLLHIIKHPVNTLADLVSITEMGPRSAEVEAAYRRYTSEKWMKDHPDWTEEDAFIQSLIDAQDVTVNFTKSGKWAKQINQVTAFFNVSIRGPEKAYRTIKERPIQTFVKGITWLTTIAVASWYRNKDKDWYKNLPPAYKYNNLFFEIGKNVYRLPIPFELGMIFMAAPQAALDTMKDKDSKSLQGLLDLAKSQIPDPTPSMIGPAIEVGRNKNYLGVPIESPGMQYLYPTERKRDYTTKLAVELSKGMDKIDIHYSPIQLDYLIDSYSGGFLRQFRISGEELTDLPVIGDLMLRDPSYPKRQLNEYFSDWEVLGQKKGSGIATRAELKKLSRIDGFYKTYKTLQGNITKAKKANNQELVVKYSNLLRERLERYGYK